MQKWDAPLFYYNIFDIGPDPDQIRDAFIYMKMWDGYFPLLGPTATGGKYGYSLPPLYYYLVFPITILGQHPSLQVIPNAFFSSLSIISVAYLSYQLLEKVESNKRLLLSGLAALWYAFCFPEVFISTFTWNPSPIPFFFLSFILLCYIELQKFESLTRSKNLMFWGILGILFAILISLHSSTLFVIPAAFIIISIWFIWKYRKIKYAFLYPLLSLTTANIALFPYWKLEIARQFTNTKGIIKTILGSGKITTASGNPLWIKIKSLFISFYELGDQAYFIGINHLYTLLSFVLFSLSIYFCLIKFKGNWTLFILLNIIWFLFLYAATSYSGEIFFISYKFLILIMPLTYTILALGYLNHRNRCEGIMSIVLVSLLSLSILTNVNYDLRYLSSKIGSQPITSVNEIITTLKTLPDHSLVCYPQKQGKRQKINQYDYINQYIMNNRLKIVQECSSDAYLLYPKYRFNFLLNNRWPLFDIEKNSTDLLDKPHQVIYESSSLKVLKFE